MKIPQKLKPFFKYSFLIFCMTYAFQGKSQINELVSSGGNQVTTNYQLSESFGQVFVHNIVQDEFYLSEGFQQHHNVKVYRHSNDVSFKIYPNPVRSIVNIKSDENLQYIGLYNEFGALIKTFDNINQTKYQLNLDELLPGVYFIKLVSSNHNQSIQKIIKS